MSENIPVEIFCNIFDHMCGFDIFICGHVNSTWRSFVIAWAKTNCRKQNNRNRSDANVATLLSSADIIKAVKERNNPAHEWFIGYYSDCSYVNKLAYSIATDKHLFAMDMSDIRYVNMSQIIYSVDGEDLKLHTVLNIDETKLDVITKCIPFIIREIDSIDNSMLINSHRFWRKYCKCLLRMNDADFCIYSSRKIKVYREFIQFSMNGIVVRYYLREIFAAINEADFAADYKLVKSFAKVLARRISLAGDILDCEYNSILAVYVRKYIAKWNIDVGNNINKNWHDYVIDSAVGTTFYRSGSDVDGKIISARKYMHRGESKKAIDIIEKLTIDNKYILGTKLPFYIIPWTFTHLAQLTDVFDFILRHPFFQFSSKHLPRTFANAVISIIKNKSVANLISNYKFNTTPIVAIYCDNYYAFEYYFIKDGKKINYLYDAIIHGRVDWVEKIAHLIKKPTIKILDREI